MLASRGQASRALYLPHRNKFLAYMMAFVLHSIDVQKGFASHFVAFHLKYRCRMKAGLLLSTLLSSGFCRQVVVSLSQLLIFSIAQESNFTEYETKKWCFQFCAMAKNRCAADNTICHAIGPLIVTR